VFPAGVATIGDEKGDDRQLKRGSKSKDDEEEIPDEADSDGGDSDKGKDGRQLKRGRKSKDEEEETPKDADSAEGDSASDEEGEDAHQLKKVEKEKKIEKGQERRRSRE
jgi:hypothetical protein